MECVIDKGITKGGKKMRKFNRKDGVEYFLFDKDSNEGDRATAILRDGGNYSVVLRGDNLSQLKRDIGSVKKDHGHWGYPVTVLKGMSLGSVADLVSQTY